MERARRKEIRTDYAGTYVAYIYDDGHIETDPPGRPLSKEDVQRQRLQTASQADAKRMIEARRARLGRPGTPAAVVRENAATPGPRRLMQPFALTQQVTTQVAATFRTPVGMLETLKTEADLGGEIVGPNAGERPEYADSVPYETGEA